MTKKNRWMEKDLCYTLHWWLRMIKLTGSQKKGRVSLLKLGRHTRQSLSELCRTLQPAMTVPRSLLTWYLTLAVKSLICWSRNFLPFMEAEGWFFRAANVGPLNVIRALTLYFFKAHFCIILPFHHRSSIMSFRTKFRHSFLLRVLRALHISFSLV